MASNKSGGIQQIDLAQLPLQQLNQLSQQLEQEIEFFSSSLSQLKIAQSKFVESEECVGQVSQDNKGKEILVPLTSSMYVAGQLSDADAVLVDIGTGYYVEMVEWLGNDKNLWIFVVPSSKAETVMTKGNNLALGHIIAGKSPKCAKDYFARKVDFISKQMEKIQPALQEKYRTKQVLMEILQMRVQQQLAAQQQLATPSHS